MRGGTGHDDLARCKNRILEAQTLFHLVGGVALMLLSVLLTLFTATADDGAVWTFPVLVEQVIKNNMTTVFPMCITLIAGTLIAREQRMIR